MEIRLQSCQELTQLALDYQDWFGSDGVVINPRVYWVSLENPYGEPWTFLVVTGSDGATRQVTQVAYLDLHSSEKRFICEFRVIPEPNKGEGDWPRFSEEECSAIYALLDKELCR